MIWYELPLANTLILLLSGGLLTLSHHALLNHRLNLVITYLAGTLVLALIFTSFQAIEYLDAPFTIADGMYGSTFYMATGFHGFHVIVGSILLLATLLRF